MPKSKAANPRRTDNAMTNKKEKKKDKKTKYIRETDTCVFFFNFLYFANSKFL